MILIDRLRTGLTGPRRVAWRTWRPSLGLEERAPLIVTVVVGSGLLLLILLTPATSSDSGQWLMASRYYLGEEVPAYRVVTALPPLVPLLLTAIRLVVPDPFIALHLLAAALLVALAASLYVLGCVAIGNRWAGALSVVLGLFATDRFLELFAFGGLLQLAAVAAMALSVAAFARAAQGPGIVMRWWMGGSAAIAVAALSHAATGLLAVAVGVVAACLAALAQRGAGWRALIVALSPLTLVLVGIGAYWSLVLLPANGDYISNPASLAYRGPGRLFGLLIGHWPSAVLLILGIGTLARGVQRAWGQRRIDGYVMLLAWVAVTWGALAVSMLSGAGTDYPRFATPMMAPIAVAASGGAVWILERVAASVRRGVLAHWPANTLIAVVVMTTVALTAPMVVARHTQQADYYDLRDASALNTAVTWVDERLVSGGQAVLSDVREGKWIEGLTGRESLFSQPVRYAFRRAEWQRSLEADTLMRSTLALTSGYVGAFFTDVITRGDSEAPANLVLQANHGGEMIDLLRLRPTDTLLMGHGAKTPSSTLAPQRSVEKVSDRQISVSTVWNDSRGASALTQSVTIWRDGTALRLALLSPENRIATILRPAGLSITSLATRGHETNVCFTEFAGSQPCVRIWASQPDVTLRPMANGALRIETWRSDRLNLLVTALTTGKASVGLNLLHPDDVIEARNVGAALLYSLDPAYSARARRLERLGFSEAFATGPYRVLLREMPLPHLKCKRCPPVT
jgi:hypothetical protein